MNITNVHFTSSFLVGLVYPFPMDCVQIMKNGNMNSGIYTVYINNDRSKPIQAYCDMDTDGGGWLVWIINKLRQKLLLSYEWKTITHMCCQWISYACCFQMLQRRTTGRLDFMKRWRQYIAGFGNMTDEFWIGELFNVLKGFLQTLKHANVINNGMTESLFPFSHSLAVFSLRSG